MEAVNELDLRSILERKKNPKDLVTTLIRRILDPSLSWEDKRVFWLFLYNSGRHATLMEGLIESLKAKSRVPFDALVTLCAENQIEPTRLAMEALLKGLKRQKALGDIVSAKGWDKFDTRPLQLRQQILALKSEDQKQLKQDLLEKFEFLHSQRMREQAGKVLRRLISLYPEDINLKNMKSAFDEQWARDVLSLHASMIQVDKPDRTLAAPSVADQQMLKSFAEAAEKFCIQNRSAAVDLAFVFLFMEDFSGALGVLAWAAQSPDVDWLKAETLILARRFIEAMELLNHLEVKFSNDPESTFAVSYLRAQCLYASGQQAQALEIMQSIVRVRPNYRSAHALILDWTAGVHWE